MLLQRNTTKITGFFMGMTKSVAKVLAAMIATAAVPAAAWLPRSWLLPG